MNIRSRLSFKAIDLLGVLLSLAVLVASIYYPYISSFGFTLNPKDWRILAAPECAAVNCVHPGDRVLSIGSLDFATFSRSRSTTMLDGVGSRDVATLRVLREGRELSFPVRTTSTLASLWSFPTSLIPLVFWLMGTTTIIFLRPRDVRWAVLVGFSYVIALMVSTGLASSTHLGGSAIIFHVVVWLFMPLSVHLHLILPSALLGPRARRALLGALYGTAFALVALDAALLLPRDSVLALLFTSAGVLASVGLLLVRLFLKLPAASKLASRIMLFSLLLSLGPFIFFYGVVPALSRQVSSVASDLWSLYSWLVVSALISLPILPMGYIYAIYKHHLGALEFRANRLLGVYSFATLAITSNIVILFLVSGHWGPLREDYLGAVLGVSLAFAVVIPLLREPFQKLIDRYIFGIRHAPEEIIDMVSERIPAAFDREVLARLLVDEILPTLLIRQSALHLFAGARLETLYEQGLPAGEPPLGGDEVQALLGRAGRFLPPAGGAAPRGWVRLVIPLALQSETLGVWLIGRRDPDDFFPAHDIRLLSTVANQIAPMVENIRLYERAQQEIAQRVIAEEEIRRSEERFRNLFEATLEGIAIVKGGIVLEVNHALLAIFGYEAPELIGRELADLLPEAGVVLPEAPREGIGWKRDGSVVDVEIAAKQFVLQGEDVMVVAIRDIARRKRDEAENRMLQRQLINSQKMEAIGRLSAGVAHDFNNCLLAIFGYGDLLLERYTEDVVLQRNLSGIKDAAQKAASLTRQLLAFARRQPMESKVVDLNAIVKGVEKMLRRLLGDDVTLVTELHPGLERIKVDPGKLDQVVVNLAVNARHAMPTGGQLSIRTAPLAVAAPGTAPHGDVPPGSYAVLSVADTGTGMDAETQARAFEPFFSTKEEGTGLGLATVYGIVRQSGGHIFVDSAPGEGARFSIYLPVTSERESAVAEAAASGNGTGSETILLVEDEPAVRSVLQRILVSRGYNVLAATCAEEAEQMARRNLGAIDLLLTDITMPRVKGTELAARLLAQQPRMRVIYMSGYSAGPLPSGTGTPICLQKPFSAQTLARTVRSVLDPPESVAQASA
jgi:two-component system cell cycle sensor histidine kinase/response regulator CckA